MSSFSVDDAFDPFEEFDPLAADDEKIDQQDMDDDNPLDTVDSPPFVICRSLCKATESIRPNAKAAHKKRSLPSWTAIPHDDPSC